ncbi:MAG TPA: 6-carboxytetrahydropterin synthase QueD [Acidiferrobacter sp.]|nr:6-carboxytetrahydropterin synthase QueD [Acidiferrobacter sp.]
MEIFKSFRIEAAHKLPRLPEGHKCRRLHGHSFQIDIHVRGVVHEEYGWVQDFADITAAFRPLFEDLDHHYLNDIAGLENPTSERLAQYIWERLAPLVPGLARIVIHETCTAGCAYEGPGSEKGG